MPAGIRTLSAAEQAERYPDGLLLSGGLVQFSSAPPASRPRTAAPTAPVSLAQPAPVTALQAQPRPPAPVPSIAPTMLSASAIFAARREAIRLSLIHREPDDGKPTMDPDLIYSRRGGRHA